MGWTTDYAGHEGYLVAIVEDSRGLPRELYYPDNTRDRIEVRRVSIACECGWRSPYLRAPLGTYHAPHMVFAAEDFEDACREIYYRQHVSGTTGIVEFAATVEAWDERIRGIMRVHRAQRGAGLRRTASNAQD